MQHMPMSQLSEAYGYYYDPDFGVNDEVYTP
jgi:hypothetical protein